MNDELLVIDYADNDEDLEKQWADWNQMTHHNRKVSDDTCMAKYNMTNLERYEKLKSEFNKQPNDYVSVQDPKVAQDVEDTDEKIQESESNPVQNIYFVSENSMDDELLTPRIPSNYLVNNGYEDKETKRICFSTSIDGCLAALSKNIKGHDLYVHVPDHPCKIYKPTTKEVPDCKITNEVWVKHPISIKCIGKIHVEEAEGPGIKYTYGDNKSTELYKWKWKWLKKYNKYSAAVTESKLLYPSFNPSITNQEAVEQGGFYDHHGIWNSILTLSEDPGRLYRGRVECLIINDNKVFMSRKPNNGYRLPGGSFEIKNDNETQCYNECKEEARILVKNIKNTGIIYTKTYSHPVDWARNLPVQWTGQYIEVYVADFDRYYNGTINFDDRDEDMYNNGEFYNIDDVYDILRDEHKKAIDKFVRNINEAELDSSGIQSGIGVTNINIDAGNPNPLNGVTNDMYDAAKAWSNKTQIPMILERNDLDELEREYIAFMSIPHYHKKISNQESIRIFGFNNIIHYKYLKNKLLRKDETDVDVDDIMNIDDSDSTSTITEEYVAIVNPKIKKKIAIIKEELQYNYNKINIYNMLNELSHERANFVEQSIINNFVESTKKFIKESQTLLPYYTPKEMEELGVFNENIEDNFYKTSSNKDAQMWFELYSKTGKAGNEWYNLVTEAYRNTVKNPSNENKQRLLEFGWNPEIKMNSSTVQKVSKITEAKLGTRYNLEVIDITESLNDLDDYKEIAYINTNLNSYHIADYLLESIELEHTSGRIFVDYNDIYVAHITIYSNRIVGIGSNYNGSDLLFQMIEWAVKEKGVTECKCRVNDNRLINVLRSCDFAATDMTGRIALFTYEDAPLNESTIYTILEDKLATKKRNKLKDSEFGIPELRKYPLNDEAHVKSAIKFFNYTEPKYEKELAKNINKKIDEYELSDISVGENNRFSKYYKPYYNEATKSKKKDELLPVYIVTTYTATTFGKVIQAYTHNMYTHASIGFDSTLNKLYSFNIAHTGGKMGGLSIESIQQYLNDNEDSDLNVSVIYLKKEDFTKLQDRLDLYIKNVEKTSYNFRNIFNIAINKVENGSEGFSMVCSQFVDSMLKAINIDITGKPSNLVTPGDLSMVSNPKVYKVYEGKAKGYNPKNTDKILHKLVGSIKPILESKFIRNAKIGIYYALPIFEAKELPIGFDDSGALLIKNYKTIDYNVEYTRCNKLLKSYKTNKNYEGMKYELCKLWFMNTVLLKKIEVAKNDKEKEALVKSRAKIMNDFTIYLNEVNKNVPGFNFSEYYEQTPFGDAVIKISGSTLKYTAQYLKAALAAL